MKNFYINKITYEDGNRTGVCGLPVKKGIYISISEIITDYHVEYNSFILFNHDNDLYIPEIELNFKNKIEYYLRNDKDLNNILKFKKYKNVVNCSQLKEIMFLYYKYYKGVL